MILIFLVAMNREVVVKSRKMKRLQGYNLGFFNAFTDVFLAVAFF
jgi:hypothetical protein